MSNNLKFAIVAVIVNLHTLRNLSFVTYIAIYGIVSAVVAIDFMANAIKGKRQFDWGPFAAWLFASLSGLVISLATISATGAMVGLSRFLFAIPIFLALCLYTDNLEDLRDHIKTLVVFFAIASATLPMQLVTGPIAWFAGASERAGIDRFASLVGSLTSIGIAVGSYLVLTHALTTRMRSIWMVVIAISAAMSLSKAAIANIAIAFGVLLLMNRRRLSRGLLSVGLGVVLVVAVYAFVPIVQERVDAVLVSFGFQNSAIQNYDVDVEDSFLDRIFVLPAANLQGLEAFGTPLIYVFGAGFGMADSALVPDADSLAPMAHNQYVEVFSVFGVVGVFLIIGALLVILRRLIRLHRDVGSNVTRAVVWAYVLMLINSVTANGTLYQPATATIILLAMYCAVASRFLANSPGESEFIGMRPRNVFHHGVEHL